MSTQNRYRFEDLLDDFLLSRLSPEEEREITSLMDEHAEWKAEALELKAAVSTLRQENAQTKAPAGLLAGALQKARQPVNVVEMDLAPSPLSASAKKPQETIPAQLDSKPAGFPKVYLMAASILAVVVVSAVYFAQMPESTVGKSTLAQDSKAINGSFDIADATISPKTTAEKQITRQQAAPSTVASQMMDPAQPPKNKRTDNILMNKGDGTPKAEVVPLIRDETTLAEAPKTRSQQLVELAEQKKQEELNAQALDAMNEAEKMASGEMAQLDEAFSDEFAEDLMQNSLEEESSLTGIALVPTEVGEQTMTAELDSDLEQEPLTFQDSDFATAITAVPSVPALEGETELYSLSLARSVDEQTNNGRMSETELRKLPGAAKSSSTANTLKTAAVLESSSAPLDSPRANPTPIQETARPAIVPEEFIVKREIAQSVTKNQATTEIPEPILAYLAAQAKESDAVEMKTNEQPVVSAFHARFDSRANAERFLTRLKSVPVSVRQAAATTSNKDSEEPIEPKTAMLPGYKAMRSGHAESSTGVSAKEGKRIIEEFNFDGYEGQIVIEPSGQYTITISPDLESGKPLPDLLQELQPVRRF